MRAATTDVIAWQDHGDDAARARAVQSVEAMVWYHARRAHRRVGRLGVDLEDLVAAGHEGAVIATNRFDRTRGVEFAAAANMGIAERVMVLARHGSGVTSLPKSNPAYALEIAINRATAEGEKAGLTTNESFSHAARAAGVSTSDAAAIARRSHAVTWDQAKHDRPADDDLEDRHAASVARLIEECLAKLPPREADVVRRNVMGDRTLLELGEDYGVSGVAMGQSKRRALEKLGKELRRRLRPEDLL